MKNYLAAPAALSWPFSSTLTVAATGDLDGDGRQEVLVADTPLSIPSLGVLSYFRYGDLADAWKSPDYGSLLVIGTCAGSVQAASTGTDPWQILPDDLKVTLDLDGDGAEEVVVFSPDHQWIGVLKWTAGKLQLIWATSAAISGEWTLPPDTSLYPVRSVDAYGQNFAGVVAFSPGETTIGLLKWTATGLAVVWIARNQLDSVYGTWPINATCHLLVADVNGDMLDELVLLDVDPLQPSIAVLKWNPAANQFSVVWGDRDQQLPLWLFSLAARFSVADIDGDLAQELVVRNSGSAMAGVLKWKVYQTLELIYSVYDMVPQSEGIAIGWSLFAATDFVVQHIGGTVRQHDQLVVFDHATGTLGIIGWVSGALQLVFRFNGTIPAANGPYGWVIGGADQHYPVDLDQDGSQELIVFNPQDLWIGILKWQGNGFSLMWSQPGTVSGWSLATVAAAPQQGFPAFVGVQLHIYQYASRQADEHSGGDIRGQYLNENNADAFSSWAAYLKLLTNPGHNPEDPSELWSDADWTAVVPVLALELDDVGHTWGLWQSAKDLSNLAVGQQNADFNYVNSVLTPVTPDDSSDAAYWGGQIAVALFWGVAAVPLGEELVPAQIMLAIFASFLGSTLGWSGSTPQQVSLANYQKQIQDGYSAWLDSINKGIAVILGDPQMLALMGTLCDGAWYSDVADYDISACQSLDRITMYSNLIPVCYSMNFYHNIVWNCPVQATPDGGYEPLESPSWAYSVTTNSDGTYDVQLLWNYSPGNTQYPSQAMMQDLFDVLNVPQADFFSCQGMWKQIPQNNWN